MLVIHQTAFNCIAKPSFHIILQRLLSSGPLPSTYSLTPNVFYTHFRSKVSPRLWNKYLAWSSLGKVGAFTHSHAWSLPGLSRIKNSHHKHVNPPKLKVYIPSLLFSPRRQIHQRLVNVKLSKFSNHRGYIIPPPNTSNSCHQRWAWCGIPSHAGRYK